MEDRFGIEACSNKGEMEIVPDVLGALRGIRSFQLDDKTGYLTGVIFHQRWTEGIMEAQCLQTKVESRFESDPGVLRFRPKSNAYIRGHDFVDGQPVIKKGARPADCPGLARGNHGCGFYAYHGQRSPGMHYASGVVEMFGQVELGPLGVRSSKARLIALLRPDVYGMRPETLRISGKHVESHQNMLSKLLDERPASGTEAYEKWQAKLDLQSRYLIGAQRKEAQAARDLAMFDQSTRWLYPNTPVFDSMESMLAEFPVPPLDHLFEESQ